MATKGNHCRSTSKSSRWRPWLAALDESPNACMHVWAGTHACPDATLGPAPQYSRRRSLVHHFFFSVKRQTQQPSQQLSDDSTVRPAWSPTYFMGRPNGPLVWGRPNGPVVADWRFIGLFMVCAYTRCKCSLQCAIAAREGLRSLRHSMLTYLVRVCVRARAHVRTRVDMCLGMCF